VHADPFAAEALHPRGLLGGRVLGPDGKPKYKGSGKDLQYFDEAKKERYTPHVIEPSAGADRVTPLSRICFYARPEAVSPWGGARKRHEIGAR
jgi:glycyl-tRNA synthetase